MFKVLGVMDLMMNLGLAIFIGIRAEALSASLVFLMCYGVLTYLFHQGEENYKGSHFYLAMWGMKEGITAMVAALLSKVAYAAYSALASSVRSGKEITFLDADRLHNASQNGFSDWLSEIYHQLVVFSESFGLTDVDHVVYAYLAIKSCWIFIKACDYAAHSQVMARMKTV